MRTSERARLLGLVCWALPLARALTAEFGILERPISDRIEWGAGSAESVKRAAVCITDRVRDLTTLETMKAHVLDALGADLLVYTSEEGNSTWGGDQHESPRREVPWGRSVSAHCASAPV